MKFPVLVCDDSNVARKQVCRILAKNPDFEIIEAGNGQEALTILRAQEIGLVCLDLTMPVLDGIGLLSQLKEDKIVRHIVVISADVQTQMQTRVKELGALDFLAKPVDEDSLKSVLHKFGIY